MFFTDTPVAPVSAPAPVAVTQRLRNMIDATVGGMFTPDDLLNELSKVEYDLGLALTEPEDDFGVSPLDETGWPVTTSQESA